MKVKFIAAPSDQIESGAVEIKDGQIVVAIDGNAMYYDFNKVRRSAALSNWVDYPYSKLNAALFSSDNSFITTSIFAPTNGARVMKVELMFKTSVARSKGTIIATSLMPPLDDSNKSLQLHTAVTPSSTLQRGVLSVKRNSYLLELARSDSSELVNLVAGEDLPAGAYTMSAYYKIKEVEQ